MKQTQNNMDRGDRLWSAVETYAQKMGITNEEHEVIACDFLSDFFHWCDMYAVDIEELLGNAQNMYESELEDDTL